LEVDSRSNSNSKSNSSHSIPIPWRTWNAFNSSANSCGKPNCGTTSTSNRTLRAAANNTTYTVSISVTTTTKEGAHVISITISCSKLFVFPIKYPCTFSISITRIATITKHAQAITRELVVRCQAGTISSDAFSCAWNANSNTNLDTNTNTNHGTWANQTITVTSTISYDR
jgi:hypothetical protein